ncbi:cupin-like protein [Tribonema minus]|uniref:Cupin-like protein n=1 Tax=Tribonema minus TaxID=303371 RepID=A0A835YIN6_9STRA|nr:cupin-like protein [Tribonema minus]
MARLFISAVANDGATINYATPTRSVFRTQFDDASFKFDLDASAVVVGDGGVIGVASVTQIPALFGEGIAMARITLDPCGINVPHVVTSGTEMVYAIDAESVLTAFADETGTGRTVVNTLHTGDVTFSPRGLVRLEYNMACTPAILLTAINSEDYGVTLLTTPFGALATLPSEPVAGAIGITVAELEALAAASPSSPALQRDCLAKCGLSG